MAREIASSAYGLARSPSGHFASAAEAGNSDDDIFVVVGNSDDGIFVVAGSSDDDIFVVVGNSDDGIFVVAGSSDDGIFMASGNSDAVSSWRPGTATTKSPYDYSGA